MGREGIWKFESSPWKEERTCESEFRRSIKNNWIWECRRIIKYLPIALVWKIKKRSLHRERKTAMYQSLIRKELYEDDYLFNEQEYKGTKIFGLDWNHHSATNTETGFAWILNSMGRIWERNKEFLKTSVTFKLHIFIKKHKSFSAGCCFSGGRNWLLNNVFLNPEFNIVR